MVKLLHEKTINPNFILCLGDDVTDEDMFLSLTDKAYTVKAGRGNAAAKHTIQSQEEVYPFLNRLAQLESKVLLPA